jgi:excisionase family DNA binding protein
MKSGRRSWDEPGESLRSVPVRAVSPNLERLLTREEAADALNVTLRFVTRCVQERRIRYIRVGRMVRIPESAIREYLVQHSVAACER